MVAIEVVNFGKSKKKDFEKGFYVIKQKPKQTTTYTLVAYSEDNHKTQFKRTVYVAKNEEEKRKFEELAREKERERNELLKGKRQPDGRIEIDMSKFR